MQFFFNTNGFAHHRIGDVVAILEELGYHGISLTVDVHHADLVAEDFDRDELVALLRASSLEVAIETGGRFILDRWRKHRPNLLDAGAEGERRLDFYRRSVDLAVDLRAPLVSLWSGALPEDTRPEEAEERLAQRLGRLLEHAAGTGVAIAFEPEPGMLVETLAAYAQLRDRLQADGHRLRLTCDLGHLYCTESPPYDDLLRLHASDLVNVHIDDIAGGEHVHLELGEGDIDFPPLLAALAEVGYAGPVSAELSRSSHRAVDAARDTIEALRRLTHSLPAKEQP